MTSEQEDGFGEFLAHYRRIRDAEGWGGDDLDLPFRPRRHHEIWNIRRRTFGRVARIVRKKRGRGRPSHETALDVAAGNCWLSGHLVRWGFDVTAMDINADDRDGLGAGRYLLEQGLRFRRVRAPAESIPFPEASFDLVIVSGGLHYFEPRRSLSEFRRVLNPGGRVVVCDSPWYARSLDGERGVRQRKEDHARDYGIVGEVQRDSSYLLHGEWERNLDDAGFSARYFFPWTGFGRAWAASKARLKGQRLARFPVVVLRVRDDG